MKALLQSNALLLCAMIVLQFAIFEAGLRLRGGSEAAPDFQRLFAADPRLGYRLQPRASVRFKTPDFDTHIAINSSGVRDREIAARAPDERRIVVLGDSLVMAVQVPLEEAFPAQLERMLNDATTAPASFRVVNAGVQGYGPVEEYLFHRHVTSALRPDVVVLTLYTGNDAIEAAASAGRLEQVQGAAEHPGPAAATDEFTQWRRRIVRRSMVLQIARLRLMSLLYRFGWGHEIDPPLRAYLAGSSPEIDRGLVVIRDTVARLAALTSSQGARLVVLLLPARFQVDDGDFLRLKGSVAQFGESLERDLATHRFKTALEGVEAPVVDALPQLKAAARQSDVFMQSTAHLTPFGHQAVAEVLDQYLRDSGVVDGQRR